MKSMMGLFLIVSFLPDLSFGEEIDFAKEIRPIFVKHCYSCHGEKKQKNGFRLDIKKIAFEGGDAFSPNIVPGKAKESPLYQFISDPDADLVMPPEGDRLSPAEIEKIQNWIDQGALWPEGIDEAKLVDKTKHWSFQPLLRTPPPAIEGEWPRNEIDRFIFARLKQNELAPSPRVDRRTWLRRVSLSLTGLLPTPEEIDRFVNDPAPDAEHRIVDALLASPRYGERWAQHWLDVVRYADTHGFEVNTPRDNAWPYRDYVIRAFNEDKPYDEFVREQIAGDQFEADEATGFLVASAVLLPGQIGADDVSKRLARQDSLDEIIVGTGGSFLGLTIGCARCHDHKFDPLTQKDYYSFQAFLAGIEYLDRPINDPEYQARLKKAESLVPEIEQLEAKLNRLEPLVTLQRTVLIDDEDDHLTTSLKKDNGQGENPEGNERGFRDDPGATDRAANIGQGSYTWWDNVPGEDVFTYNPGVEGRFQLWLSWGVHGSGVHTRDARYLLDRDGDLSSCEDQQELARIDQYYPAWVKEGETPKKPLWSGLYSVGFVELEPESKILVRGGETGTGITADVIVLQEQTNLIPLPALRASVSAQRNVERFAPVTARYIRFTTLETIDNNRHEPCLDELEIFSGDNSNNLALDATPSSSGNISETGIHQLKHINDGKYGNSWSWISNELGEGWVQLELSEPMEFDRVVWGRDRLEEFRDRLPIRYRIEVSLDGKDWKTVATESDREPIGTPMDPHVLLLRNKPENPGFDIPGTLQQLKDLRDELVDLRKPRVVFAGKFRAPDKTFVLRRGDPEQPTNPVGPMIPEFLGDLRCDPDLPEPERRKFLANWIASPENPLTARVLVNRIWQNHFGFGLVETANDFGLNGTPPSHPELLDWLAAELIRNNWSIKHIQRLIVTSATFGQASKVRPEAASRDRDNRLLWRFTTRRLSAEAIRDTILQVSGELNLEMGGPGFDFFNSRGGLDGFPPIEKFESSQLRRMIYSHRVRMERVPIFGAFDCPDFGQPQPRRNTSTTPIQALGLFNAEFVIDQATAFATRVEQETKSEQQNPTRETIQRAFQIALGRSPNPSEEATALEIAKEHGMMPVCRALFNSNEFLYIP